MSSIQLLLVAGTHGNEINAPWIFDQWQKDLNLIDQSGLKVVAEIGNPDAREKVQRYLDRDLNRSFLRENLNSSQVNCIEIDRARELVDKYGQYGSNPCQIVIDLHSTTSSMGTSLVVYGRRPVDLALVSLIQNRLGVPIYLYEGDLSQQGFMVESWPCGFVVEIGPVPQGLLHSRIISQTFHTVKSCIEEISKYINCGASFPEKLLVHRHLKNIDFPRDSLGRPSAFIHSDLQGRDWYPIRYGHPLFTDLNGNEIRFLDQSLESEEVVPVFINEAAYVEKNIAMSLTKREVLTFDPAWKDALYRLIGS
ncbi:MULTISPECIES: aspartoacylase [unclassified Prochlorococcus]|uniref:aspartoacylase n=1 Tax=unclassified Prochlorococcus TaxID=2627481 RepID=UPI000533ACEB|nr:MULTISPECIES: aspartoacylase [unclassified Prochlorococcus]KGG16711.1 putative aspartoacylase [Prochlorococcus sp. MIT 0602]KGG18317.1 putative aspartoacylase [Prochlorococcus sp. MIT 0603]